MNTRNWSARKRRIHVLIFRIEEAVKDLEHGCGHTCRLCQILERLKQEIDDAQPGDF